VRRRRDASVGDAGVALRCGASNIGVGRRGASDGGASDGGVGVA
jgi:hypothetical protein